MKISWDGSSQKINKISKSNGINAYNKVIGNNNIRQGKDQVVLSKTAQDFSQVMNALRNVPDIREDKVNEVLQRMESGKYNVNGKEIMDKLMPDSE
jgi:negative regulator of flagellin synthesis FlgM